MRLPTLTEVSEKKFLILFVLFFVLFGTLLSLFVLFGQKNQPMSEKQKTAISLTNPTSTTINGKLVSVPPKVRLISAADLNLYLQRKENIKIVQISSASEWQAGHIAGSIFIPAASFDKNPVLNNDQENLALVSKDSLDAILVAEKLVDNYGFDRNKTLVLQGGLLAWQKAGFPIQK